VRALAISDTHLGAWTGRDLLAEERSLERLAPQLDEIDELIVLGDLFDFLFGSVSDCFAAAEGLFELLAEKLHGKRFVFLAGNHDHHLVHREAEDLLELEIATGQPAAELRDEVRDRRYFADYLERRLPETVIEIRYPTYTFGDVLLTHGHYLDPHARLSGSRGDRLLTKTLWSIATGGPEEPKTVEDYESVITLLTEWLYIAAQMPHGTHAQQNVFRAAQRAGRVGSALSAPVRGTRRLGEALRERASGGGEEGDGPLPSEAHFEQVVREETERRARESAAAGAPWVHHSYPAASVVSSSDPSRHALEAFAQVVANLGWGEQTDKIVFAHTHQPLADVRSQRDPSIRYWNTGSWIYEPDLSSRAAYGRYLRNAWPGTAVLIDTDEEAPQMVEMLEDLNPLNRDPA
jgi:UDP-2,3-diacylglucosamine pyrophosphatase LpxH